LFRNTLAQSTSIMLGYLFSFILAPLMIARLGLEAFGVWAVTGAFATYAGLLDLGIGRSLARFVAVFDAHDDPRRIRECVGLGLIAVTIVGLVAGGLAIPAAAVLNDQLGVLSAADMRVVVFSSVAIFTLNAYRSVLNAVGVGKRRMVPPNVASTIAISINFAFSIAALIASSSLAVYALANAAAALIAIVPGFFAMRYLWRAPYAAIPSKALVKEVLAFSVKNQIGWIADLVNFQTDKVVIALVVDVRAAAAYEIASRVVLAVRGAAILTISAMIPTAAAKIASEGRQVVGGLYRRYTLRTCAIAFPLFMLASVSAPFLLIAWLGTAPGDSALLISFLTLAYLVHMTTGVGSTITIGAGHPGMVSSNAVGIAAANIVLTAGLAPLFGVWGVVAGTFISVTLGSVRFTQRFLKLFELPWSAFLNGVLPTGLVAVGLALPPAVVALIVGVPDGRPSATAWLVAVVAAYGVPYWLIATHRDFLPEKLQFPPLRRHAGEPVTTPT
jgi:O-antigen/teichoic acid export membrane protein